MAALGGDLVELTPQGNLVVNGVPRAAPPLQCSEQPPASPPPTSGASPAAAASDGAVVARRIPDGTLFVLGDCPARSTDSRSWGPLPIDKVVARPVVRIWPPDRQGAIVEEEDLNPFRRAFEQRAAAERSLAGEE